MTYEEIVFKLLDALESAVLGEGGDGWGMLILTSSNISMEQIFEIVKEWKNIKQDTWWEVSLEADYNGDEYITMGRDQEFIIVVNRTKFETAGYECVIRY